MAVRPIRILPDPVLRLKAVRVREITPAVQRLIDDMVETMHAAQGVGLAANQIGVLQRVAVIQIPEDDLIVLINPEIIKREGEREVEEGCLSVPGYRGILKRSLRVVARAQDRQGKTFRIKAEGLLAQALEHETDHLNGILYVDRLESRDNLFKITEPEEEEGDDGHEEGAREGVASGTGATGEA